MPRIIVAVLTALLALALTGSTAQAAKPPAKPTVVLVHGAFADASGWSSVIERLEDRGYPVLAPANPLRGVAADSAYLRSFLETVPGPIVLVGHSYGGFVLTNAATGNANVKALVYVAAFAPDQGDSVSSLGALGSDGMLGAPGALTIRPFAAADGSSGPGGLHRSGAVPGDLRRRPAAPAGAHDGAVPAPRRAANARRAVGRAGVADDSILVPGRRPRQRDRYRHRTGDGRPHPPAQDR